MQYKTGTVSTTLGSATVTGTETLWTTNVKAGDLFFIDEGQSFEIATIVSDTELSLTAPFNQTVTDEAYAIVSDFTPNFNLPLVNQGDLYFANIFSRAMRAIDSMAQLGLIYNGSVISVLATPPTTPAENDRYIVGASATGAWAGKDNYYAQYVSSAWVFTYPAQCEYVLDKTVHVLRTFMTADGWQPFNVVLDDQIVVDATGKVVATGATLSGALSATTGTFSGNLTIGAAGGGNRTVTINSAAAGNTLIFTTYDASAGITSVNLLSIVAINGYAKISSTNSAVWLISGAAQPQYFDAGGIFYWRDLDSSNAVRMSIDSATGNLIVTGKVAIGQSTTAARKLEVVDGTGNQIRATYSSGTYYCDYGADLLGNATIVPSSGTAKVPQLVSTVAIPTIAAGAGAGTAPTLSITGDGHCGQITLIVGSSPSGLATVATATLAKAFPNKCIAKLMAANNYAAQAAANIYVTGAAGTFSFVAINALTAGLTYTWNYTIEGY